MSTIFTPVKIEDIFPMQNPISMQSRKFNILLSMHCYLFRRDVLLVQYLRAIITQYWQQAEIRKRTRHKGDRERCLRHASKSNFGLLWLDPWPPDPKVDHSYPCPVDHLCQNESKSVHSFSKFGVFTRFVTNEQINAPVDAAIHSGLVEPYKCLKGTEQNCSATNN